MIDIRLRSKISKGELESKVGKILTDDDYNLLLTRDTLVRKPDGKPLAIYRRGVIPGEAIDQAYPTLHELRKQTTNNRSTASGQPRIKRGTQVRTPKAVPSAIVGAFDPSGQRNYCRLSAWTGRETEKFRELFPLFRFVGEQMARDVPDRHRAQMEFVRRTHPFWVIEGTPFTTITINNTYATGVHTDSGDLDEGFSCLATLRRGDYSGGVLVFPEYRVGVDMGHGDLVLMDAHEFHGNTRLVKNSDDAERISIVHYYRTKIADCGTPAEEAERGYAFAERTFEQEAAKGEPVG